jgi:serine/threonine-protein kinase
VTRPAPERLGRYRIVSELGRGAMGVVYKGEDAALERTVAIKTILMTFASEEHAGYLARFRQEARALGALNHPSIISVYDFGDEGDIAYMAMEFLEGRELREIIAESRPAPSFAVDIAAQVAEGLAFAHARGIVHRDVKPGNIMVLEGRRAKIMDFGIARVRASDVKTQAGLMLGSPRYMSPEQILGQSADHRSDIFSLGVVLYQMVAGAPPFSGEDIPQLMYAVCNARPTPPSHLNPDVPEVLDLIVAKALEKTPESRYQDAAELATDLRRCAKALPRQGSSTASRSGAGVSKPPGAARSAQSIQATQAMAATAAAGVLGLSASRRFDSTRALARLARPEGADRALLSPSGRRPGRLRRLWGDGTLPIGVAVVGAAVAVAVAIATA